MLNRNAGNTLLVAKMSLSAIFQRSRTAVNCGIFSVKISKKFIYTHKMSEKPAEHVNTNGFESKTPFLIGVAGGTASGKVSKDIKQLLIFVLILFDNVTQLNIAKMIRYVYFTLKLNLKFVWLKGIYVI